MNVEMPLVSILMTSYNREKFIGEAIESVLSSTYTLFELIIVDDCSRDGTVEISRSYSLKDERIRVYVNDKNLGDYHNRNKAAEYAKGKYIKYLDSDDIIYPDSLKIFVQSMESFPEAAVGIMSSQEAEKSYPIQLSSDEAYRYHFYKRGIFDTGPSALIFRTDRFWDVGGFSGKRFVGDIEMNLKLAARWPIVMIEPSLIFWRQHDGQEFQTGLNSTGYLEYNLLVIQEEFKNNLIPFAQREKDKILSYYRKISATQIIKIAIINKRPAEAFRLYRRLSLGLNDLFNAVFFSKRKY